MAAQLRKHQHGQCVDVHFFQTSMRTQECKALNGRLLDFLKQPGIVEQLVTYLVVPAPPGDAGTPNRRRSMCHQLDCGQMCLSS